MVGAFRLQVWICKAALLVLYSIHDSSYLHGYWQWLLNDEGIGGVAGNLSAM